jgi:hypothetical protein
MNDLIFGWLVATMQTSTRINGIETTITETTGSVVVCSRTRKFAGYKNRFFIKHQINVRQKSIIA